MEKNIKMKKINLKNILKKTFKKKADSRIKKVSKKTKTSLLKKNKVKKKAIKKVSKKITKIPKKKEITKIEEKKLEPLRISKSNEQKPEIKKIKKQETAKKEYKPKDYVVYPKHGVGQILSVSSKTIGVLMCSVMILNLKKIKLLAYCQSTNKIT